MNFKIRNEEYGMRNGQPLRRLWATPPRLASFAVRGRGTDSRKWRVIDNPSEVTDVTPPPLTQGRLLVEGVQGRLLVEGVQGRL